MIRCLFLSALACLFLTTCKSNKDRKEIAFTAYLEIPAGLNTFLTYHFPVRVATHGAVPANIIDAQPARMRAFLEYGEASFNFARRAYMDAVTDSSRVEMGYNLDVPLTGVNTLDLNPSTANLATHISQDSFDIEFKVELRNITSLTSRVRLEFSVLATLQQ